MNDKHMSPRRSAAIIIGGAALCWAVTIGLVWLLADLLAWWFA